MKHSARRCYRKSALALACAFSLCALSGCASPAGTKLQSLPPMLSSAPDAAVGTRATLRIHLTGEVVNPGSVELSPGATLWDAICATGGFTPDADGTGLILDAPVADGQQIAIKKYVFSAKLKNGKLDINAAGHDELVALPGIGEVTAERIIAYRQQNGAFTDPAEVANIPGLSKRYYQMFKDLIDVGFNQAP